MDIAVVHDILDVKGGAERLMITLAEGLDADFYTLRHDEDETFDTENIDVKEITPFKHIKFKPRSLPLYPIYHFLGMINMVSLNLKQYDLVITSGKLGMFAGGKKTIWYCHSPARFLYDLRDYTLDYLKEEHGLPATLAAKLWWYFWKGLDQKAASRPDIIVANSENVKDRVKKYYDRDAVIVHPPTKIDKFRNEESGDYFLSVQRPNPEQGIDLQLDVFSEVESEIKIVGDYQNERYKGKMSEKVKELDNVTWLKSVSDEKLVDLYARCKAVIQTSRDEDFGMVPVEAMASGKPVIAVNEGGFKETVVDGETGILVDKPYQENLVDVIDSFDEHSFDPERCHKRAEKFSEKKFMKRMERVARKCLKK